MRAPGRVAALSVGMWTATLAVPFDQHGPPALTVYTSGANQTVRTRLSTQPPATMTAAERDSFVYHTNLYRCMHGAQPAQWSEIMAAAASEFVQPLTSLAHSDSYSLHPPQGENLYWNSAAATAAAAVRAWYAEVNHCRGGTANFSADDGCKKPVPGKVTGHFTAMIWNTVTRIGCGFSKSGKIAICRYAAPGDSLSLDTPNMNSAHNYKGHVLPQSVDETECASRLKAAESQRTVQEVEDHLATNTSRKHTGVQEAEEAKPSENFTRRNNTHTQEVEEPTLENKNNTGMGADHHGLGNRSASNPQASPQASPPPEEELNERDESQLPLPLLTPTPTTVPLATGSGLAEPTPIGSGPTEPTPVGNGPAEPTPTAEAKPCAEVPTPTPLSGEDACSNNEHDKAACEAVGCCHWAFCGGWGKCQSSVGEHACKATPWYEQCQCGPDPDAQDPDGRTGRCGDEWKFAPTPTPGPSGAELCEGLSYDKEACAEVGCCWFAECPIGDGSGRCFSNVGKNECVETPFVSHSVPLETCKAPSPTKAPCATPGPSGKDLCEGHSYDKDACSAVGCCWFAECPSGNGTGTCFSGVGEEECAAKPFMSLTVPLASCGEPCASSPEPTPIPTPIPTPTPTEEPCSSTPTPTPTLAPDDEKPCKADGGGGSGNGGGGAGGGRGGGRATGQETVPCYRIRPLYGNLDNVEVWPPDCTPEGHDAFQYNRTGIDPDIPCCDGLVLSNECRPMGYPGYLQSEELLGVIVCRKPGYVPCPCRE